MGDRTRASSVLMVRSEGKRPLESTRYRWENNIDVDLQEFI
jgi:hypothetical protein